MNLLKLNFVLLIAALFCLTQIGCDATQSGNSAASGGGSTTHVSDSGHATVEITAENFDELVTNSSTPVLLDFWAPWCGPCVKLTPTMEELAGEYKGKFLIGKVNVDEQPDLAKKFDASGIPLLVYLKGGEVATTSVGFQSKEKILADMEALME